MHIGFNRLSVKSNKLSSTKKEPANFDLVKIIDEHMTFASNITLEKVKGHSTNKWNNYADKLAVQGTEKAKSIVDKK